MLLITLSHKQHRRHMTTFSLKRKDQAFFGMVYASILIKFK
jgi:hypothetical protein